ncbi:MAG: glycosyltransferase family 4 protein [Candidatus Aenigmatarchaeota archaeon]|nr:glycosyltransferase family 4 protein [Candidatus Aenigmarchaeota archaeon]
MNKKIFMIGWEYPPYIIGGLGRVCYHLTKELVNKELEVIFLTPFPIDKKDERVKFISPKLKIVKIGSWINPYYYEKKKCNISIQGVNGVYYENILEEVKRFTKECEKIIREEEFDIIHCHDWMTFEAGILAKKIKKKPLVVHVHSTELDRGCGLGICKEIFEIERKAFEEADKIITVSNFMKNKIMEFYNVQENKIEVVHNAFGKYRMDDKEKKENKSSISKLIKNKKVVLYLGRVTLQKGPEYFLRAAKIVSDFYKDVVFVFAGYGELLTKMIELACELGIIDKVIFTGYLKDEEVEYLYRIADVYVMPSVSEPFGITALEAAFYGNPTIISKNSGVKEVLKNSILIDFWDVRDIANKILAVLNYDVLNEVLKENGRKDVEKITWSMQTEKIINNIYEKLW